MGRKAFYSETFKDEILQTEVEGTRNGPLNPVSVTKAISWLGGKPPANLQVPLQDVTLGGQALVTPACNGLMSVVVGTPKG